MKRLLLTTMLLGSTIAVAACSSTGESANDLDGALTQAPYAEERTVGATEAAPAAPVVRSAEPVFESRQVK